MSRILKEIERISELEHYVRPAKIDDALKLDSNENFALDWEFINSVATESARRADLREYPLDQLDCLYSELAGYAGVKEKFIGIGSGSDQIIELLLTTLGRGCRATVFTPTFSYFINRCELHGIKVSTVPLDGNFDLDVKAFLKSAAKSDIAYICSPNNPTGNQFDKKTVMQVIDSLHGKLVLVDEAYSDFADYSLAASATKQDNMIVLRTLSKAFGLAGARVGYMVTNERLARLFRSTIQSPYPVSTLSLTIAASVLQKADSVRKTITEVRSERKRMSDRLAEIKGIRAFKSDANFIFIETGSKYRAVCRALKQASIVVKLLDRVNGHAGCMRVTIGTREMNDRFLRCIEEAAMN